METHRRARLLALSVVFALAGFEALAAECDVTLSLEPRRGKVDEAAFKRVNDWLRTYRIRITSAEVTNFDDGARLICVVAPSRLEIGPLFDDIRDQLPKASRAGWIRLYSSTGQSVQLAEASSRRGGFSDNSRPPRNNGISERPPLGNRN